MIAYLKGTLLETSKDSCVLLTSGGVGYLLRMPAPHLQRLPQKGDELALHVHTVVREDALELYGFYTKEERDTFVQLLPVSKLGPKTALAILSTFEPSALFEIIHNKDSKALTRVSGIGAKSAERIIWELKDKFPAPTIASVVSQPSAPPRAERVFEDALSGLLNLGYIETEIRPVLARALEEEPDLGAGEAIRATLKNMAKT
jgi:Holliday junction DNA helicase RuvA